MKKLLLILLLLCVFGVPYARAQTGPGGVQPDITSVGNLQNAAAANGNGSPLSVKLYGSVAVIITITGTATVNFEAQVSSSDSWTARYGYAKTDSARALVSTATASGVYFIDLVGDENFRARVSSYSSGTVTVTAKRVPGTARVGIPYVETGGGSGTVTSVSGVDANGFTFNITNPTSTPAITLDISALDAAKIADGSVSNAEFQRLDGVTSAIQTQLNAKLATTGSGASLTFPGSLSIASGKTATVSNTLTLAGTDGSTLNVGTGGTLGTGAFAALGATRALDNLASVAINAALLPATDASIALGSGSKEWTNVFLSGQVKFNGIGGDAVGYTNGVGPTFPDSTTGFALRFNTQSLSTDRIVVWPDAAGTVALTADNLSVFAATTSAELFSVISNETGGGGLLVGNSSPTIITPSFTTGFTIGGAATSRKIIVGNGTNFVASTETYAVPGSSGNVMTSDGTNWTSAAPAGGGITIGTTTIANGTDTKSLYNNAGVVGERTVTGTGNDVLATSPTFTTSLLTGSTTFAVFNATPTTINAFGAATTINIGAAAATWNIGSNSTINGGTSANDDITIQGTSNATRATSYVAIQPSGGGILFGTGSSGGSAFVEIKSQGGNQYPLRVIRSSNSTTLYGVWEESSDGSAQLFMNDGSNVNTVAFLTAGDSYIKGGKLGVGTSTVSARLHSLATTEQLRLGYDASNYFSTTVGSTGSVTLNAVGSGSLFTFSDNINIPHIIGGTSAPSIAAGAGAGTSPTVSLTGTDLAGQLNITSGTLPSVSAVISTITFNVAYGVAPYCLMWPANSAAAVLGFLPYISSTTTTFTVNAATVGLAGATQYLYNYACAQ